MSACRENGHGRGLGARTAALFASGREFESAARELGVSRRAVRKWQLTYRAVGKEGLLRMERKHTAYGFETKVAAASAVVDGGMAKPEAMERFGVVSANPLDRWCRLYREGGAEALRPQAQGQAEGRPRAEDPRGGARARGQAARGAHDVPKKSIALKAELGLLSGRGPRP